MAISIDFLLLAGEWAKCLQEIIESITESSIYADVILTLTTQRALVHRHNRHLYVYVCDWMCILKCIAYYFGRRECVGFMKGTLQDREQGKMALIVC